MIREVRRAVRFLMRRFRTNGDERDNPRGVEIPEDVKRQIDAEGNEIRRELVRLQGRMMQLAEEYRQGDFRA